MYDNRSSGSSDYSNSYIKKYLEEVVKVKMEVTTVSLPKWKGKDSMNSSEIGTYDKTAIVPKKITDYTAESNDDYKNLRKPTISGLRSGNDYCVHTWIGTSYKGDSAAGYYIDGKGSWNPIGVLASAHAYHVLGIRPAIEY